MKPAYKPVLCVVSSHPIKGASGVPTGFFLAELTHPLKVLEDAGIKTTIASIRGGQPPVDGFDLSDPVNAWYWNETDFQQRLATTPALSELKGADYSAVFFAGGHGTMWDFRDNQDAQRIIREVYESDGIVSAVCHGPAALVDAKLSSGEYLIKGKNVAAFTNKEEEEVPFLSISRRPIRHLQMAPVTAGNRLNPSTANPSTRREPISRSQDIAILRKVFITYPTVPTVE